MLFLCTLSGGIRAKASYTSSQKAAFLLATLKPLALFVSEQSLMLDERKHALVSNVVALFAHTTTRLLDPVRDKISKGLYADAAVCQLIKAGEEYHFLRNVERALRRGCDIQPLLSNRYHGVTVPQGVTSNDMWWQDDFSPKFSQKVKHFLKYSCLVTEWALSMYAIHNDGKNKHYGILASLGQTMCDMLIRFVFNEGTYKSPLWIEKAEMIATAAPLAYDMGNGVVRLLSNGNNNKFLLNKALKEKIRKENALKKQQEIINAKIQRLQGSFEDEELRKVIEESLNEYIAQQKQIEEEIRQNRREQQELKIKRAQEEAFKIYVQRHGPISDSDVEENECRICLCEKENENMVKYSCCSALFHKECAHDWYQNACEKHAKRLNEQDPFVIYCPGCATEHCSPLNEESLYAQ